MLASDLQIKLTVAIIGTIIIIAIMLYLQKAKIKALVLELFLECLVPCMHGNWILLRDSSFMETISPILAYNEYHSVN